MWGSYFSGKLELELETSSDLTDARSLSQSYPKLKAWISFIESINTSDLERGFLENQEGDAEEEEEEEKVIEGEATQNMALALELLEDNTDSSEEDEEWTEMCQFLSQTQKAANNTPKHNLNSSVKKRKSSVGLYEDANKKSKIAEDYESSGLFSPNATIYRYE